MWAAILAAMIAGTIAIVPYSGDVVTGPRADCVAMALEVRFQLAEVATSDGDGYPIYQSKLREFALTQSRNLDACVKYGRTKGGR